MKIIDWIVHTWYYIKLDLIDYGMIQYKYLDLQHENVFIDYIEEKARELTDKEGINIYFVPYDEMNKNEPDQYKKAIGMFKSMNNDNLIEYERIMSNFKKEYPKSNLGFEFEFPRIEITEKADVFTILHELGHYFLYKRNIKQSEEGANLYIEEFFNNHLPSFFKWIYQIDIQVRGGKKIKYTSLECYKYFKEYHKFKLEYGK